MQLETKTFRISSWYDRNLEAISGWSWERESWKNGTTYHFQYYRIYTALFSQDMLEIESKAVQYTLFPGSIRFWVQLFNKICSASSASQGLQRAPATSRCFFLLTFNIIWTWFRCFRDVRGLFVSIMNLRTMTLLWTVWARKSPTSAWEVGSHLHPLFLFH